MTVKYLMFEAIWLTSTLVRLILFSRLLTNSLGARLPEFRAYLFLSVLVSGALQVCAICNLPWAYTYIWAVGTAAEQGLVILVAIRVSRSLGPFGVYPPGFIKRILAPMIVALSLSIALYTGFKPHQENWLGAEFSALRSTSIFIAALFWSISFACDYYKIPMRSYSFGISLGFTFLYSVQVAETSSLVTATSNEISSLKCLFIATPLISSSIWLYFFSKKEPALITLNSEQLQELAVSTYITRKSCRGIRVDARRQAV
jgi:hypothetical protein